MSAFKLVPLIFIPGPQSWQSPRTGATSGGGRTFPQFTAFIPKNHEYLAQLSGRLNRKKMEEQKKMRQKKVATFFFLFLDILFLWGAIYIKWSGTIQTRYTTALGIKPTVKDKG